MQWNSRVVDPEKGSKKRALDSIDIFGSIAVGPIVVSLDGQNDIPVITIVPEDSDQGGKKSSSKKRLQQLNDDLHFHDDDLSETSIGDSEGTQSHHIDARERRRIRDQVKRAKLLQDTSSAGVALLMANRERRRERDRLRRLKLKSDLSEEGRLRMEATKERRRENDRRRRHRLRNQERLSSGEDFYADEDNDSSSVSAGVSSTIRSNDESTGGNKNNTYANFKDAEYIDGENIEITIS